MMYKKVLFMNQLNHKMMLNMIQFSKRDDDDFNVASSTWRNQPIYNEKREICVQENEE